jgi:hypothetical protein
MAKKNLKKTTTPAVTISQPASTSRDDVHTPVTTQFSFFNFITIANTEDIKKFLRLAATTTEGENLKYLWERAYEDGYENGRKSLLRNLEIKMDNKFEEGIEKGMSLGREEGYTVAKEGFDGIINAMRAREASKTTVTTESGIQTDPSTTTTTTVYTQTIPQTTTTTSVSTQTSPYVIYIPPLAASTIQTDPATVTTTISVPTDPIFAESISYSSSGTQTETTTSQHLQICSPSRVATSQSLALTENGKNAKIGTTRATTGTTSEILPFITVFTSSASSANSPNSTAPPTITTALETRSSIVDFIQKHEKVEKSPVFPQITPEPLVSACIKWADDAYLLSKLPTITTALETRSTTTNFAQKHQNIENSPVSPKTTPQTPVLSSPRPTNDTTRVHTSSPTPSDVRLQAPTVITTASSSPTQATPYPTGHEKSTQSGAVFKSQAPKGFLAPASIVTAQETRSEKASFMEKHQNIENSPILAQNFTEPLVSSCYKSEYNVESPPVPTTIITDSETRPTTASFTQNYQKLENSSKFTQNPPESAISKHFNWAEDAAELPMLSTTPTKYPRDFSGLRSSSTNPFSSLRRRHWNLQNARNSIHHSTNSQPQHHHLNYYPSTPRAQRQFPQTHFSGSSNWDCDPRLFKLSRVLKTLVGLVLDF